tara:strand:- start:111 stop:251 length:141 start_codon:yes stop_codon:yes gene_type:complete
MTIYEMRCMLMQKALEKYPTIKEAAKALGCNERTLFRYIETEILKK